jgi:multidrug efflux pump subunit AcrA (membrane-fusion protein)
MYAADRPSTSFTPPNHRKTSLHAISYPLDRSTIAQLIRPRLWLAAHLSIRLLLLVACGPEIPVAVDQQVPIRVRTPARVQQPASTAASGAVKANVTAQAAFQIAGRLARVFVDESQQVAKGQVLAELDTTDYRNAHDAAVAQVDAAQATQKKAQAGLRPEELAQARIDFEHWQDEYTRMKFLYDHQSLPANDFQKIEASYQTATQRYEMAREGTRGEEKEAASAELRAAVAQMREAGKDWLTANCARRLRVLWVCGGSTWAIRSQPARR